MAQFRLEVKIHKRGANGSGIMQKACYNARESLYDDEVGLRTKLPSKSKVEELCFKQIFLPEGANEKFLDRNTLWNEVQNVERAKGAQLAREFVGNLPLTNMLPLEESKKILKEFAEYLTSQGMICDVALHYKESNINFHILCPMRKLKENGKEFAQKRVNAYVCKNSEGKIKLFHKVGEIAAYNKEHNTDFERIPLLDKDGNQKMRTRKGRKPTPEWERKAIDLTGWNDAVNAQEFSKKRADHDTSVEKWRHKLCEIGNKYLSENQKWEHKSYERQGINKIPTVHEGAKVQYLEKKEQKRIENWNAAHPNQKLEYKPVTTLRKQNEKIRQVNKLLARIGKTINEYQRLLSEKIGRWIKPATSVSYKKQTSACRQNEANRLKQKQIIKQINKQKQSNSLNNRKSAKRWSRESSYSSHSSHSCRSDSQSHSTQESKSRGRAR